MRPGKNWQRTNNNCFVTIKSPRYRMEKPFGTGDFFRQNSGSDYFHRIVKKMTGYKVPYFDLFQFRCFTLTFFSCKFAAACKAAARSAVDGASHLALQRKDFGESLRSYLQCPVQPPVCCNPEQTGFCRGTGVFPARPRASPDVPGKGGSRD